MRIAIIVTIASAAAYWHMSGVLEEQHLGALEKYVKERGAREASVFELAKSNHDTMLPRLKYELENAKIENVEKKFYQLYAKKIDGSIRDADPKLDNNRFPTFYHGKHVPMTKELMRTLLISREFISYYGRAYEKQFADTYVTTPENSMILFWPGLNWGADAPSDLDMRKEEYITVADAVNNPERITQWTGMYYDVAAKVWMVSIETPLYIRDKLTVTIGHDILLNEMLDRAIKQTLPGTKNIIFRADGRLIAHPDHMDDVLKSDGKLNISLEKEKFPKLHQMFQDIAVSKKVVSGGRNAKQSINESKSPFRIVKAGPLYYGTYWIPGANWYFVVEYPKALISSQALEAAKFILILGIMSLIFEIAALFLVLRGRVANPLQALSEISAHALKGNYAARLEKNLTDRDDEIGLLGTTFNKMLDSIQERDASLKDHAKDLEKMVEERTEALVSTSKLASLGAMAGGIAHEINNPLAVINGTAKQISRFKAKGKLNDKILDEGVEMIIHTSDRISSIVRGLRSFAREGADDPMEIASCKQLIDDSVLFCLEKFNHRGVKLEIIPVNPELKVSCRPVQLSQVIVNLLQNALDAVEKMPNPWVRISLEESGDKIVVRVRDSGGGIPVEVANKMMQPFFTTKPVGKGTGLGLSISHGIIESHKGEFKLNQECSNTEFYFSVPKNNSESKGVAA